MPDVNEEIVKQFFEKNGFLVKTNLKYMVKSGGSSGESDVDLAVLNLDPDRMNPATNIVLEAEDLKGIERAVVEIKGWHELRFTPSLLAYSPRIFNFVRQESLDAAKKFFKNANFKKILVLSELPVVEDKRSESIQKLKKGGIDHVIEFKTILKYITGVVKPNKNYRDSEFLQTVRLLKSYDLLK
ncbi:MAG: hypothetical protein IB616_05000 [Methanosarcinales archaeon]|nr:MAG: hypothetical protein IB616_05000 [Methanosarcinales archaeon]